MLLVSGSTRTVGQLATTQQNHLGHLLTLANRNGMGALLATGLRWAADNGCYRGLHPKKFRRMLRRVTGQPRCLFVACPDRVADAVATLRLFGEWALECRAAGQPLAFVGQDGIEDLEVPWSEFDAWFVGGSTRWKLSGESAALMLEAKRRGKWVHVGRVNSLRRLRWCYDHGADSADGSSMSMYGDKYIHRFCCWLRVLHAQPRLFGG